MLAFLTYILLATSLQFMKVTCSQESVPWLILEDASPRLSDPYLWKTWCNDLMDWSQRTAFLQPRTRTLLITPHNLSGVEIKQFVYALGAKLKYDEDKPGVPLPTYTQEGRTAFRTLLNKIDFPYTRVYAEGHLGHQRGVVNNASEDWYLKILNLGARKREIHHLQRQALNIALELEAYPAQYPKDAYFTGYALLYAAILRMHWEENPNLVLQKFKMLETRYQSEQRPVLALMAAWYRALLLAQQHKQAEALQELARIQTEYKQYGFSLVDYAKDLTADSEVLQNLCIGFFHTPIRYPSRFLKPGSFELFLKPGALE